MLGNFEKWRNDEIFGTTAPSLLKEKLDLYQVLEVQEVREFEDMSHLSEALHFFLLEAWEKT